MIDQEKHAKLHEKVEQNVATKLDWLRDAMECKVLCDLLPEEIKEMYIISADANMGGLKLHIKNVNGTVPTLKRIGIQGLKPQVSWHSPDSFQTEGEGKLPNGAPLEILVTDMEKPPNCTVRTKRKWKNEYELVCEKSGKVIK